MQLKNTIFTFCTLCCIAISGSSQTADDGALKRFMSDGQTMEEKAQEGEAPQAVPSNSISQLLADIEQKAEPEKTGAPVFSLLANPDMIKAYDYLKINDRAGFLKLLNSRLLNSTDEREKAQLNYWSGSVQFQSEEYKKAATNFLEGYKSDISGMYGAYNLFGLAESMQKLDKGDEGCSAINKLQKMIEQDEVLVPQLFIERLDIAARLCIKDKQ